MYLTSCDLDGKLTPKSMTFKKINTNELWNPDAVLADKEHLMTLLPARDVSKATETTGPEHQASVVKETKAADEQGDVNAIEIV